MERVRLELYLEEQEEKERVKEMVSVFFWIISFQCIWILSYKNHVSYTNCPNMLHCPNCDCVNILTINNTQTKYWIGIR